MTTSTFLCLYASARISTGQKVGAEQPPQKNSPPDAPGLAHAQCFTSLSGLGWAYGTRSGTGAWVVDSAGTVTGGSDTDDAQIVRYAAALLAQTAPEVVVVDMPWVVPLLTRRMLAQHTYAPGLDMLSIMRTPKCLADELGCPDLPSLCASTGVPVAGPGADRHRDRECMAAALSIALIHLKTLLLSNQLAWKSYRSSWGSVRKIAAQREREGLLRIGYARSIPTPAGKHDLLA